MTCSWSSSIRNSVPHLPIGIENIHHPADHAIAPDRLVCPDMNTSMIHNDTCIHSACLPPKGKTSRALITSQKAPLKVCSQMMTYLLHVK